MDSGAGLLYCRCRYRVGKFHTLATTRSVCAGMRTSEPFLNGGVTGGDRGFLVNVLIGSLHLTLLFFLGIISSIVKENAYEL